MITQLAAYGFYWWMAFNAVAFFAARLGRLWGILIGHLLIAGTVVVLDLQWIQAEMHRPNWDGQPDQDFIFTIGVFIRIILVNTLLLPVNVIGWLSRRATATRQVS